MTRRRCREDMLKCCQTRRARWGSGAVVAQGNSRPALGSPGPCIAGVGGPRWESNVTQDSVEHVPQHVGRPVTGPFY